MRSMSASAFWVLVSHVLSRGSLMLAAIFLARQLSPSDFTIYSYFQITVTMLGTYAALGLGVTASRLFAEYSTRPSVSIKYDSPIATLVWLSFLLTIAVGIVVSVIPSKWIAGGLGLPHWLLTIGVMVLALDVIPSGAILGLELYKQATAIFACVALVMLSGTLLAARTQDPVLAMLTLVISFFIQAAGQYILITKYVGVRRMFTLSSNFRRDLRTIGAFAGPMFIVSLLAASGPWAVGRMILSTQNGNYEFALYSIGLQWFAFGMIIPGLTSRVVLPRVVRAAGLNSINNTRDISRIGALTALVAAVIMSLFVLLFGTQLIRLYGHHYDTHPWLIIAFVTIAVVTAPSNAIGNVIVARDGQFQWLLLTIFWFILVLFCSWFTRDLGTWSGAIALGAGGATLSCGAYSLGRRRNLI